MRIFTSIVVLTAVLLGIQNAQGQDVPDVVTRTHAAVVKDADSILKLAYPTAGKMNGNTQGTFRARLAGGYSLDETFNYADSDGAAQAFTLTFTLDANGKVMSVTELNRSELWPTFGTGNLLLAAAKAIAQDQVDQARQNNQEPPKAALLILQADDIKDLVVIKINVDR